MMARGQEIVRPDGSLRSAIARSEVALWMAVVEDAEAVARVLGRRKRSQRLPAEASTVGMKTVEHKRAEEAALRRWIKGEYVRMDGRVITGFVGSLPWIADQVSGAAGINFDPAAVAERMLRYLDGEKGRRAQKLGQRARGIRRIPRIYALSEASA